MQDDDDFVKFHDAKSGFEAQLIVSILKEAGIAAHGVHDNRTDEFAMAQQLMNRGGGQVFVAADKLEDAKAALAAAREAGKDLEENFDEIHGTDSDNKS